MNQHKPISGYKFPGCQKYWLIKRKDFNSNADVFDISMGYSTFYFRGKTLKEAENRLLDFIKEEVHKKRKAAQKLVNNFNDFLEDERVLTTEQLLEKYKTM